MTRRICWVIGAGPAGMYATQAILRSFDDVAVILTDARRVPFGLGRFGIAPDHPKMRRVVTPLERIVDDERVTFVGGVHISGAEVEALAPHFDAVVIATGAGADHPTEFTEAVPSREFFGWYNADENVDVEAVEAAVLADRDIVVIGGGNVSIDIVRLLCVGEDRLRATDMPDDVVDVLSHRPRRPVHLVVRSAAASLKFSAPMITELVSELGIAVHVHHHHSYWGLDAPDETDERRATLTGAHADDADLHIYLGAVAEPAPSGGLVIASTTNSTALMHLPEATVVIAVGYAPGLLMAELAARDALPANVSVCGWAANGAKGVLGTNKADAIRVVDEIKERLEREHVTDPITVPGAIEAIRALHPDSVGIEEWRATVEQEIREAAVSGRLVERVRLPRATRERKVKWLTS